MTQQYQDTLSALERAQDRQDYIRIAAREYQSRQSRTTEPLGTLDKAKRWFPHLFERCSCCNLVRAPSRRSPDSLLTHCRTAYHVARLYDVSEGELLAMAQTL